MSILTDEDILLLNLTPPAPSHQYYICENQPPIPAQASYLCNSCSKRFQTFETFILKCTHYKNSKLSDHCFICDFCAVSFKFKSDLEHHLHKHERTLGRVWFSANFPCYHCPRVFTTSRDLSLHVDEHNGYVTIPRTSDHVCSICGYKTYKKQNLESHISRIHSADNEEKHSCQYCEKSFSSIEKWKSHEKYHQMTASAQDLKCKICGVKVKTRQYLSQHMQGHAEKTLECPREGCTSKFNMSQSLKRHIRVVHDKKEIEYTCRYCHDVFNSCTLRLYHESRVHNVESCFTKKKIKKK